MPQFGFSYHSVEELAQAQKGLGVAFPLQGDPAVLRAPVAQGLIRLPNALAIHPMEGCDADDASAMPGAPGPLTFRRYRRFAEGGAGLIWAEAISVTPEARANPRQLMITPENVGEFARLVAETRRAAQESCGHNPFIVAQLTHSGRWSRPIDPNAPIRADHFAALDAHQKLADDAPVITDDELAALPAAFARAAVLCRQAGFDSVDLKACHLYLYSELLGAINRGGRYGGSYENRVRLMLETAEAVGAAVGGDYPLAARINVHDNTAGRWGSAGFTGDAEPDMAALTTVDLAEPKQLAAAMAARGVSLFNITMGTPYFNPHINRPYATGGYEPPENPLVGVARLLGGVREMQAALPEAICVATGLSYLRHFAGGTAAGLVQQGWARVVGMGRMSFAYPDFPKDAMADGMKKEKSCLACGKCTTLMRAHRIAGCPVRDQEIYLPELRAAMGKN